MDVMLGGGGGEWYKEYILLHWTATFFLVRHLGRRAVMSIMGAGILKAFAFEKGFSDIHGYGDVGGLQNLMVVVWQWVLHNAGQSQKARGLQP